MKQVETYVKKYQLIDNGDRVVIGLSGGADSVCLLFVLLELQQQIDFSIYAVHVNHNLRGQEAERDAAYVRELCEKLQISVKIVSADVLKIAKKEKIGTEEAGRLVRYKVFESYAEEMGANKIALAHHQNDLAETMIYHLARGTDLKGLSAIRPVRGKYIRPLLGTTRKEIENYLKEKTISYVTDSTNEEDCYTRNRIRHHVIEYLEKEVNTKTVAHMSETAESLGELYDYLQKEAGERLHRYGCWMSNGECIPLDVWDERIDRMDRQLVLSMELFLEPTVLVGYVLRMAVELISGSLKDITREHVMQLQSLAKKEVGKKLMIPGAVLAVRHYADIRLQTAGSRKQEQKQAEEAVALKISEETFWNGYHVFCQLDTRKQKEIDEKKYTKWFDYDKIKTNLVLRFRRPGDYLVINQQGGKKRLKDYFIDQKIPRDERDQIPLICVDHEVLWVYGHRISEAYKVQDETKTVLKIQFRGGIDHG